MRYMPPERKVWQKIQANDVRSRGAARDQASGIDAQAQQESSAIAVLENSLSHDRQTLERLDRELADYASSGPEISRSRPTP